MKAYSNINGVVTDSIKSIVYTEDSTSTAEQRILNISEIETYNDLKDKLIYIKANFIPKTTFAKYKLGDVNQDGNINTTDSTIVLDYIQANEYKLGDVDKDGTVGPSDAYLINAYIENPSTNPLDDFQKRLADVNQDGVIDQKDVDLINATFEQGTENNLPLIKDNNLTEFQLQLADINQDGIVDATDHLEILSYAQGVKEPDNLNSLQEPLNINININGLGNKPLRKKVNDKYTMNFEEDDINPDDIYIITFDGIYFNLVSIAGGSSEDCVKSSDSSNLNWITMTEKEFNKAKQNNTLPNDCVINVIDNNLKTDSNNSSESSVIDLLIYYWDGRSAENTSTDENMIKNIELWQEIYEKSFQANILVIDHNHETTDIEDLGIVFFIIEKGSLANNTTNLIYSTKQKIKLGEKITSTNEVSLKYTELYLTLDIQNNQVTIVTVPIDDQIYYSEFLSTQPSSKVTEAYIPEFDYQPSTKKYVDDLKYNNPYAELAFMSNPATNDYYILEKKDYEIIIQPNDSNWSLNEEHEFSFAITDDCDIGQLEFKLSPYSTNSSPQACDITISDVAGHTETIYPADADTINTILQNTVTYSSPITIKVTATLQVPSIDKFSLSIKKRKSSKPNNIMYLSTNNSDFYDPLENYHPATKKYVDDTISNKITDSKDIVNINGSNIAGWGCSPYDYGTPTPEELTSYLKANNNEWLNKIQDAVRNGTIFKITNIQSTADRRSRGNAFYYVNDTATFVMTNSYSDYVYMYKFHNLSDSNPDFYISQPSAGQDDYRWNTFAGEDDQITCFTGDMIVLGENEEFIKIQNLKIGDKLYTLNENTKEIELKQILDIKFHERGIIYDIHLLNSLIRCTCNHKFYTKNGLKEAKDIRSQDLLLNKDNEEVKVSYTIKQPLIDTETVYEIIMEDNHNFFVSKDKILVHNGS